MKREMVFLAVMAALAGEAAITYRGRLVPSSRPNAATTFSGWEERNMKFRIYDGDGNASCTIERKNVSIAPDGTFNVVLDSAELTEKVKDGTAVSVGLSIGNAPEIQPRRQLLPLTRVAHATVADGLARDARIGMLKANTLVCDTLKADGRVEARKVCGEKSDGRFDSLSYRLPGVGAGKTLELVRGKGISVFEYGFDLTLNNGRSSMRANPGDCLCKAPADGVATIRCVSNGPTFSIVRFCARGEDIRVPSECPSADTDEGEAEFAVGFHPFKDGASDK